MAHVIDAIITLRDNFSATMQNVTRQTTQFSRQITRTGRDVQKVGKSIESAGAGLTKSVTLPIVGIGAAAIKSAIESESAFAGIVKTVDATETELKQIRKEFDNMSLEIPIDKNELYGIGEAAGQLGVDKKYIVQFSETIAKLGVTTNLTSEQAASDLAKFANIVQMDMTKIDKLGSTIVDLGNNLATTESDIVAMGMRIAGAGKQIGMTEAQIMSFSGALSSVGIEAEAGGSSMSKVMLEMNTAVMSGGKELSRFAKVAGMSSSQFADAFKKDASGAMISFIEGLDRVKGEGVNVAAVLADLGFSEIRVRDALLRASGAGNLFRKSIELGNNAWEENNALNKEAETRFKTTASQIQLVKNHFKLLGDEVGQIFLPYIAQSLEKITELTTKFRGLDEGTKKTIVKFALIAAAIGPALLIFGKLTIFVGKVITVFGKFLAAVKTAGSVWAVIFTPAIKVVLIIGLVVVAIILLIKNWDKVKAHFEDGINSITQKISQFAPYFTNVFETIWNILKIGAFIFMEAFKLVFSMVGNVVLSVVGTIIDVLGGIFRIFNGIIDFITGIFTGNLELALNGVKDIFGGIFDSIAGICKGVLNVIIGGINGVIGTLSNIKVPDWVPGIGGKEVDLGIPKIPMLAKGTMNWQGGIAQVHERGGEIIDLPQGSRVYPHDKTVKMAREQGRKESNSKSGSGKIEINIPKLAEQIIVREDADIDKIARALVREIEKANLNMA